MLTDPVILIQNEKLEYVNDNFLEMFKDLIYHFQKNTPTEVIMKKESRIKSFVKYFKPSSKPALAADDQLGKERLFMDEKIFQLFKTQDSLNSSNQFTNEVSQPEYSLREIVKFIGREGLFSLIFSIINPNGPEIKTYMTVRMTHYNPEDPSSIMITGCNITQCILFDQLKQHNEILSIINATTSHELRNPLNSLIA